MCKRQKGVSLGAVGGFKWSIAADAGVLRRGLSGSVDHDGLKKGETGDCPEHSWYHRSQLKEIPSNRLIQYSLKPSVVCTMFEIDCDETLRIANNGRY